MTSGHNSLNNFASASAPLLVPSFQVASCFVQEDIWCMSCKSPLQMASSYSTSSLTPPLLPIIREFKLQLTWSITSGELLVAQWHFLSTPQSLCSWLVRDLYAWFRPLNLFGIHYWQCVVVPWGPFVNKTFSPQSLLGRIINAERIVWFQRVQTL